MLRRRIPQSGHLMTAKRFWLQTVPSEVAMVLQEFPWKKMTMVVMILVTDMFRIVTLCWPSLLTPLKQPWSGSERGFTGFRYDLCYQDKMPFFNDNSFGKSLGVKNIAKGTMDPRVEFILQVFTQILIKFHLQNLKQVPISKSQPNMNILTEVKLKDIDQT